jgi:hypothetical protein
MANRYAVGASWNDGTNGWATSTGGTPGAAVPTSSDDVFFDANSVSMSIDVNAVCKTITTTGFAATLTQSGSYTLTVSGTVTWAAGTFLGGSGAIDINDGNFLLTGGAFTSTSGTLSCGRTDAAMTFTINTAGGATFTHNSGTVRLDGTKHLSTGTTGLSIGTAVLWNFDEAINEAGELSLVTGNLNIDGNYIHRGTCWFWGTGTISLAGNFTTYRTSMLGSSYAPPGVKFDGSGAQKVCSESPGTGTTRHFPFAIEIANTGTVTFGDVQDTIYFNSSFIYTSGTYLVDCPTVFVRSTGYGSLVNPGSTVWYRDVSIVIAGEPVMYIAGTWEIRGHFTWGTGQSYVYGMGGGEIKLAGNMTLTQPITSTIKNNPYGDVTFTFNGVNQSIYCDSTDARLFPGKLDCKCSGTLTIASPAHTVFHTAAITRTSGTIVPPGTTIFGCISTVYNDSVTVLGNVEFDLTPDRGVTVTGTMKIGGNLTITKCGVLVGAIQVAGNIVSTCTNLNIASSTAAITWNGSLAKTITVGTNRMPMGTFVVNGTGSLTLGANLSLNGTGQDLTVTAGTLDLGMYNLTVNDVLTISANGTLKLAGTETVTATTKTLSTNSTVEYYAPEQVAVLANLGVTTFSKLTVGYGKTHQFAAGTTYTVNGQLKSTGYHSNQAVLVSDTPGTHWNLNLVGPSILDGGADITDCDASSGSEVYAVGSEDGGNNHNIDFGAAGGAGGGSNFNGGFN